MISLMVNYKSALGGSFHFWCLATLKKFRSLLDGQRLSLEVVFVTVTKELSWIFLKSIAWVNLSMDVLIKLCN